jgi:hypothetical protein
VALGVYNTSRRIKMSENRLRLCALWCCGCVTCELCDGKCGCHVQRLKRTCCPVRFELEKYPKSQIYSQATTSHNTIYSSALRKAVPSKPNSEPTPMTVCSTPQGYTKLRNRHSSACLGIDSCSGWEDNRLLPLK